MRRLAAALLVAVLVPRLALAAPATVRVFEAPARAAPAADAPVVHVFVEGAAVSVDEAAQQGWRRVRLPDGAVGWIEEGALVFPGAAAALPPAAPPVPPAPAPDLRPRLYVKDLGHFAELVKTDPRLAPKAERLVNRRRTAIGILAVGGAASLGAITYGISQAERQRAPPGDPDFMKTTDAEKAFVGGVLGAIATTVVALVVAPWRGDLLDVVNEWNVAHPESQFELERGHVGHHGGHASTLGD